MKTCSNKVWVFLLGGVLLISAALTVLLYTRAGGTRAVITLDGAVVETIDLSAVTETYTLSFTGAGGITNVVEVSPGKIRVREATCPDQVCVRQGWISTGVAPVTCLPNRLVITITGGDSDGPDIAVG